MRLLLDKVLSRLVRRGELVITDHRGEALRFGAPDPALAPVALRFHDAGVSRDVIRHPTLGFAEAYMAGRIDFDEGDMVALARLMKANRRWEEKIPRGNRFADHFAGF